MNKSTNCYIIDDDEIAVFGIKRSMLHVDFAKNIKVFTDGQSALDQLKSSIDNHKELPDTIFLDLNMPILDGWGFIKEFNQLSIENSKKPKIYIMTSSIDKLDLEKATQYGLGENYLVKPVTSDSLRKLLEK